MVRWLTSLYFCLQLIDVLAKDGFDLLVRNCRIVDVEGVYEADIGVVGGRIAAIGRNLETRAEKTYDAGGRYVLPGAIDGHVHFKLKYFEDVYTADDFYTGTVAAACGGVTTIIDFVTPETKDYVEDFRRRKAEADGDVVVDYGLHVSVTDFDEKIARMLTNLFEKEGLASVKMFTAYSRRGLMLDDGKAYKLMKLCREKNVLVMVHAENEHLINTLLEEFVSQGKTEPIYHAWSRPDFVEAEAVERVAFLAGLTGAEILIVHVSSAMGLNTILEARRKGVKIHGETCPHYLMFTEDVYKRPDGAKFIMSPPLKKEHDKEGLWKGLLTDGFSVVGSDHACFNLSQKLGHKSFTTVPGGVAGTEVINMILYSEGVVKRGMPLSRFVDLTAHNPAKLYGIYPRKGVIRVGADADFYILDPSQKTRLTRENLHSNIDHSIYEDVEVSCRIVATFARGEQIVDNGEFIGKRGRGEYLHMKRGEAE
ncbi:dihydropyrimidinase [Candidatus Caldarchaeum subterraneum]|uniref:Dihydropyrimidinase n=1 Tax=Caldiarchaeum subterraneum TaxID=311458 RepID=E6N575_CALS0|nr:dihydropyrimidinase [Candidatus Caldarchaeum subterraneum]BAJ49234.1 dihydropyrimidinase [Candidatus Caldarchaeum subterraneum]BAJ50283.1 dihydropyrimidinase [Candidatus Caldarchaeum subterraneum]